jgi:three-Cys-motif partner protein
MTSHPIASDGLPARESGEWASDKLFYVARYMDILTGAMKGRWTRRVYVDLMSGPGVCVVRTTGREFDGSPLLSLKTETPFTNVILVEQDPVLAHALEARTAAPELRPKPAIIRDDCNRSSVIDDIRGRIGSGALTLTFVDLLGMNVTMATLRALTAKRLRMDLIITFPEMDVTRNWHAALRGAAEHASRFDEFYGTPHWRKAVRAGAPADRNAHALMKFYVQQLEGLGYRTSILPLTMKNKKQGTLYRPIFGSRHERGIEFWEKISGKKEPSGQGRLL